MMADKTITLSTSDYFYYEEAMTGLCIACGEEVDCCEPDARQRECEACGEHKGYGVPELLIMGLIDLDN